jgi:hypothetical protein
MGKEKPGLIRPGVFSHSNVADHSVIELLARTAIIVRTARPVDVARDSALSELADPEAKRGIFGFTTIAPKFTRNLPPTNNSRRAHNVALFVDSAHNSKRIDVEKESGSRKAEYTGCRDW